MYTKIINKIKEYKNIVISRHIGVDPDALCSQLALKKIIEVNFKKDNVLCVGNGSSKFSNIGKLDKNRDLDNALLIVLDTPDKRRVDINNIDYYDYYIKIDHHPFIEKFCDIEYIDDSASSTCEILLDFIDKTNLLCNSEIFELLYMGLVSDSNRFLFNSSTSNTFNLISKFLKKYPINIEDAYLKLYLRPLNEVRLEGYIYLNLEKSLNNVGYIFITDELLNEYKVDSAAAGNMINNLNYIEDIIVWVTITEDIKNDVIRISIRSRGPIVNKVAENYNGGGHKFAAGARVKTFEEAKLLINDLDKTCSDYLKGEDKNDN